MLVVAAIKNTKVTEVWVWKSGGTFDEIVHDQIVKYKVSIPLLCGRRKANKLSLPMIAITYDWNSIKHS